MKPAKFELKELLGIGFTLIVLGIGVAYGLDVMLDVEDDVDSRNASVAINDTVDAVGKITDKLPTIATVIVASVIIGILITYLWARFAR
jgi:hypothetical protein